MSQLRLAYVNLRLVSNNSKKNATRSKSSSTVPQNSPASSQLSLFAQKAEVLHMRRPHAAAVIEKLIDDLLAQIA